MKAKELLEKLYAIGAVIRDSHIIYTSGRHGSAYVNKDAIYPHTELTRDICREIADRISDWQMEIVLAPALGGIILSQWVAFHLSRKKKKEILAIYAEKDETGETFVVRRGYDKLLNGKKVVVLEDVLTTGGSVQKVVAGARNLGATIVGVAAICNRGKVTMKDLGEVPKLECLLEIPLDSYETSECPLCEKKIPVNLQFGKGKLQIRMG